MKKSKGITLIALVITIIVLLILAGITMTLVMGENGLIARAQEAGKNYAKAEDKENTDLAKLDNEMGEYIDATRASQTQNPGVQATVLWEGNIKAQDQTATLNESIENYKYLLLETKWSTTSATIITTVDVNTIKNIGYSASNYSYTNSHAFISMYDSCHIYICFKSADELVISNQAGDKITLTKVTGIK